MNEVALSAFDIARMGLGGVVIAIGLGFIGGGAIGLLRFPDFYSRLHAASVASGVGAVVTILGIALAAADGAIALKLILLAVLIGAIVPTLTHFAANAAHAAGLAPLSGAYVAPRPGAKRAEPSP